MIQSNANSHAEDPTRGPRDVVRKNLPQLVHAYNSTRHQATGFSPFFIMFGQQPRIAVDMLKLKSPGQEAHFQTDCAKDFQNPLKHYMFWRWGNHGGSEGSEPGRSNRNRHPQCTTDGTHMMYPQLMPKDTWQTKVSTLLSYFPENKFWGCHLYYDGTYATWVLSCLIICQSLKWRMSLVCVDKCFC